MTGEGRHLLVARDERCAARSRQGDEVLASGIFHPDARFLVRIRSDLGPSHKLRGEAGNDTLNAGERFVVKARMRPSVNARARFSSLMFLTKDKDSPDPPNQQSSWLGSFQKTPIGEHNRINCTGGTCTVYKVAAFRVQDDVNTSGNSPVFVNVSAKSGLNQTVTVQNSGSWLKTKRYNADLTQ